MDILSRLSVPGRAVVCFKKRALSWRNLKSILFSRVSVLLHVIVFSVFAVGCASDGPEVANNTPPSTGAATQTVKPDNPGPASASKSSLETFPDAGKKPGSLAAYRLGPGDRLKVTVFDHPRNSGEFEVDSLGSIAYPLLGRIQARGRTVAGFQEYVRTQLDQKFIVNPRVSVEVLNYRPFYIYGEVNRAGSYPYVIGLTVRRAVAIAGGFTRRARQSPVKLVREGEYGVDTLSKRLDQPVLPGDIVEVRRRLF